MDLKTRLKQLEDARIEGHLSDSEYRELRTDLLNALKGAQFDWSAMPSLDHLKAEPTVTPLAAGHGEDSSDDSVEDNGDDEEITLPPACHLESLAAGLEIGPVRHRFRLEKPFDPATGRVWLARDLNAPAGSRDNRRALKIFAPSRQSGELPADTDQNATGKTPRSLPLNLRAALVRIRIRSALSALIVHPHIVRVYGWRQGLDGWPFVEMEYLSGRNFRQVLQQEGKPGLSWRRTLRLLRPLATALDYLHQQHNLPHRNLKLSNVFLTDQQVVKLLDTGISYRPRSRQRLVQGLEADSVLAALHPDSPQLNRARFREDIAALAALTYSLLTGQLFENPPRSPVADEAEPDTAPTRPLWQSQAATLTRPEELNEAAWQVLQAGLDVRNPACPERAIELLDRLVAAQPPTARRLPALPPWAATVATATVITALLIGGYLWFSPSEKPPPPGSAPTTERADSSPTATVPPASGETPRTSQLRDDRAFAAAERQDTLSAYRLYLQSCPPCNHRDVAEAAIKRLQRQAQIETLKTRFEAHLNARELSNVRQLQNALAVLKKLEALAPQDPLLTEGRLRIALVYRDLALESLAANNFKEARERLAQAEAVQPGLSELTQLSGELERTEAIVQDAAAFEQARRRNTLNAYQTYLNACNVVCSHRQAALAALEELKANPPSLKNRLLRDNLRSGGQGPDMVLIPAGSFTMGSPPGEAGRFYDEQPVEVRIERPFAIGRYEITFEEYARFATATQRPLPADEGWGRERRPVIHVSWQDAIAYAEWLSEQTGQRYRLPTEVEWEYAARAGTHTARYWGNNPDQGCDYANAADLGGIQKFPGWTVMNCRDGYIYTAPVGQYRANAWDLHDMLGNVLEWTCSAYEENRTGAERVCADKAGPPYVVARGGSWSDQPRSVRAADRFKAGPTEETYFIGFRVVRELP